MKENTPYQEHCTCWSRFFTMYWEPALMRHSCLEDGASLLHFRNTCGAASSNVRGTPHIVLWHCQHKLSAIPLTEPIPHVEWLEYQKKGPGFWRLLLSCHRICCCVFYPPSYLLSKYIWSWMQPSVSSTRYLRSRVGVSGGLRSFSFILV